MTSTWHNATPLAALAVLVAVWLAPSGPLVISVAAGALIVAVLTKQLSPSIEAGVAAIGAPKAVVGIAIAPLVLLPETWAAARANRLQTSLNLAIGSALASIGLTVPAVVAASVWLDLPLVLGLEGKDMALLALTFIVGAITLASGRTNLMQ
jgi:Ca2+:H+ antiporter